MKQEETAVKMRAVALGLLMVGAASAPLVAQQDTVLRPVRATAGLHLLGAVPTGEFADHIDGGGGFGMELVLPVRRESWFGLRADVGWVIYGNDTRKIEFPGTGGLIDLDLTTTNSVLSVGAGPQLMVPRGPVRPYLTATGGFAYFSTTSSIKGDNNSEAFATDTNHDDITMAWSAGGGVLVPLSSGRTPISLNLGALYHGNGQVEYVTEEGVREGPDGRYRVESTRSDANLVSIRLGITMGLRGGR